MKAGVGKASGLQIRLLGELALLRHGRALPLPPSKKTRALLAYLAVTGKPHLREHLCELLWDGPDDPRAQLRWSLSKLRPLLDDGKPEGKAQRLRADRERIALDLGDIDMDVAGIRSTTRQGLADLPTAVLANLAGRFAGNFLDGMDLSTCYRFHAWCIAQREQIHAEHVAVVTTLIARLQASPERALGHARTLLSLDPLAESSHITVVRLLKELGRTREALEQYERWRQLLVHELGGKPSHEMESIRMAIGRIAIEPASSPPAATHVPVPEAPSTEAPPLPLLGRAVEIGQLEQKFRAAINGGCREVVLLLGDPGIGKSRLLEEMAAVARRSGGRVLSGRAFEAEMVRPYGAWIDALRSGGGTTPSAKDFLPPLSEVNGTRVQTGDSDRNPMFERIVEHLRGLAHPNQPLLVLLDDIQWLDEASAALLHFVARALDRLSILLACAARGGELSDNPGVLRLLRTLERERRLHQIVLPPLGAKAMTELVASVARDMDANVVGAMVESCAGNPLYALELARARLTGENGVSQTLRVLIGERLDRLDDKARSLLPFAAAMGRSFDPQILARVQGIGLADLFSALGDLERRGIFRAAGPGLYDFSHDLIRQAAYQQLSEPRRRLVHLQLARVLSDWPDPDGDIAGDLAHHAALGGDSETAALAYLAAAQRCVRLFAWGEASELCRRGIEQLPRLDRSTRLHLHVELLGAEVMGKPNAQRAREIDVELLRVLTAAEEAGLHKDAVRGYYLRSVVQFRNENAGGAAETSWRAVTAGRSADAITAARSQAEAGRCLVLLEREIGKAKELLEGAHAVLVNDRDDLMLTWGLGLLKRYTGEPEEAATRLRQAALLARRIDSHWEETECLRALTLLALEQGDVDSAQALCPLLLELAAKMGEGSERPIAEALVCLARVLEGDETAEEALDLALGCVREADAKAMLATVLNFAAEHDLEDGHFERALARANEALAAAQAVERHNQVAIARATLARLSARGRDTDSAQTRLDPLRTDLAVPFALSAHARKAVERALREFDSSRII